ncbi:MAG: hypothetical protein JNM27_05210 [Leptospirales bacterium]|nr:hypothetical protein [Leptospirales bacterium]
MISNEFWIAAGGVHSVALFLFHLGFWRLLGWKKDLRHVSPVNRAVMQILNLRIIYIFGALAIACFYFRGELLESKVGIGLLGAASLFWVGRLVEQIIFLRNGNWMVHALTAMFVLGAVIFAMPLVNRL